MSKKWDFQLKIVFWAGLLAIGIGAFIAGIVLRVIQNNPLMWLIIAFGIILTIVGGAFTIYLSIINYKQKQVRNKGI